MSSGNFKTSSFVKKLASNDRKTRDQAFDTLRKYLSTRSSTTGKSLSSLEYQKLWKGLYYTMWFSDRPRPQQRLASELAELFSKCIHKSDFSLFVESFWVIITKEWSELDQWRVDKFYMLMRFVVRECFVKMQSEAWDDELVSGYIKVLQDGVLSGDRTIPNGVPYHIIDVWVDELEKVIFKDMNDEDSDEDDDDDEDDVEVIAKKEIELKKKIVSKLPIGLLLSPFQKLRKDALLKTLRLKIRDDLLLDSRLESWGIETGEPKKSKKMKPVKQEAGEGEGEKDDEEEYESEDEEEEWTGFGN